MNLKLKEARNAMNMTQEEMAKLLGFSKKAIVFWESGEREPKFEVLCKIADICNVTTDYLLGRTDIKTYGQTPTAEEIKQDLTVGETMLDDPSPQIDSNLLSAIETVVKKVLAEQQMASHQ